MFNKHYESRSSDEEQYAQLILSHHAELGSGKKATISELIRGATELVDETDTNINSSLSTTVLGRYGLRPENKDVLISTNSPQLTEIFRRSNMTEKYDIILQRHPSCVSRKVERRRIGGHTVYSRRYLIEKLLGS